MASFEQFITSLTTARDELVIDDINDVRNLLLANQNVHLTYDRGRIAFLPVRCQLYGEKLITEDECSKVPNFGFGIDDVPEYIPGTDVHTTITRSGQTCHFLLHHLGDVLQNPHPILNTCFPNGLALRTPNDETLAQQWPPNSIFEYTYGQAILKCYTAGTALDLLQKWDKYVYPDGIPSAAKGTDDQTDARKARSAARRKKNEEPQLNEMDWLFLAYNWHKIKAPYEEKMRSIEDWRQTLPSPSPE